MRMAAEGSLEGSKEGGSSHEPTNNDHSTGSPVENQVKLPSGVEESERMLPMLGATTRDKSNGVEIVGDGDAHGGVGGKAPPTSRNPFRRFSVATWLKYISLVVLVAQNAGQVLVMRYAMTRSHEPFLKTAVVFFNEIVKLITSFVLLCFSSGSLGKALAELRLHFIDNWMDTLKVGVPAGIYTIQNVLLYYAVENLDAGTYMVTYQLKILTTAFFTVLILKRRLSVVQWVSLLILCFGVATVQYSAREEKKEDPEALLNFTTAASTQTPPVYKHEQNALVGLATVVAACFLSGFAGIYFEKILKDSDASVWLRNFQLSILSLPIGAVFVAVKDGEKVWDKGLMQGFDAVVWVVVLVQALGGLVVAVVIKYADNILKAFATSIAIIAASIVSIFVFAILPKPLFIAGAVLVIGAVVLYGAFPYRRPLPSALARRGP